jgi:hypothetical protein
LATNTIHDAATRAGCLLSDKVEQQQQQQHPEQEQQQQLLSLSGA